MAKLDVITLDDVADVIRDEARSIRSNIESDSVDILAGPISAAFDKLADRFEEAYRRNSRGNGYYY